MERTGTLIREKYRENLISTLAMSGSVSIANIVDRIMVGNLLGSTDLAGQSLTGLSVLRSLLLKTEYNRALGFNNTIITVERPEQGKGGTGT